jgi:hypothetical protein
MTTSGRVFERIVSQHQAVSEIRHRASQHEPIHVEALAGGVLAFCTCGLTFWGATETAALNARTVHWADALGVSVPQLFP